LSKHFNVSSVFVIKFCNIWTISSVQLGKYILSALGIEKADRLCKHSGTYSIKLALGILVRSV